MKAGATIHSHWCPRCEATWDCPHAYGRCPLGGRVMVADHCEGPAPWDEVD